MTRDRGRLIGRWRRLDKAGESPAPDLLAALARRHRGLGCARVAARAPRVPTIRIDESLPIAATQRRDRQADPRAPGHRAGRRNRLGQDHAVAQALPRRRTRRAGMIGCTQPRRIAARTVARRVASELDTTVGDLVGFQVRFTEQVGEAALIKFMTDGILLAETQGDAWLGAYDTIILDEAHERSLNIDFLLGYLKRLLAKRRDLKLIVTSATIDTARFAAHFDDAPVVEVEGRTYPVEVRWRPPPERGESNTVEQIVAAIDEITRRGSARRRARVPARRARNPRCASGPGPAQVSRNRSAGPVCATVGDRAGPRVQARTETAHRARHQCRRNLADRAAHPFRRRYRHARGSSATASAASSNACTSSRSRRPPPTSARAAAAASPPASATGFMPRTTLPSARATPIRKSCAHRWPG